MGTEAGATVHSLACDYLRQKYQKPGKVYLGVVHRLDAASSGTLVLARTSKAAARLSEQFRRHSPAGLAGEPAPNAPQVLPPEKIYLAIVRGHVRPPQGTLHDWLRKNEMAQRMEVVAAGSSESSEAVLNYTVLQTTVDAKRQPVTLVRVSLQTGRKHQIRVQFAQRGYPVHEDQKYGHLGPRRGSRDGIALHAWRLSFEHPTTKTRMSFESPIPDRWSTWFPNINRWPSDT